jgi:SAM-dependent methyltransferase
MRTDGRRCEVCGGSDWETLIVDEKASVCSGRELVPNTPALIKIMCRACGLVYTAQSPLDARLDEYYARVYSSKLRTESYDYINFVTGKPFGQAVNDFVLQHSFPEAGRLLDIGCGKGFFEEAFLARYPAWTVEGVDPSVRTIELAEQRAPQARFHCRKFAAADYTAHSYDLVSMHTVLNRVPPDEFLRGGAGLLKEGGCLSIAVAILAEAPFELYFADHHYMYAREHLLALAGRHGLELTAADERGSIWRYMFRKTNRDDLPHGIPADARARIKNRVRDLVAAWKTLFSEVRELRDGGKRVAFYGAGTTMLIVLAQTDFPSAQIAGIFDDNPHKAGEEIWGCPVVAASPALNQADAVVLCAGPSGVRKIRERIAVPDDRLFYFGMRSRANAAV